ncbi:MAG: septum formation initiator family protein [Woeseiaceae bacterium]
MPANQKPATKPILGIAFGVFALLFAVTSVHLLLSADGLRKTRELRAAVHKTQAEIAALQDRNDTLAGEVRNLKHGLEAAEERARADLGMIGKTESFYQIVDTDVSP